MTAVVERVPRLGGEVLVEQRLPRVTPGKTVVAAAPNPIHSVIRHATPAIHTTTVSQRCRYQAAPSPPSIPEFPDITSPTSRRSN